ncbi:unnamed protein product [Symbiodinium sp. CCMP2592]|nr:unnamed protein product [Symbiodinium sp. CCMP2592]
MDSGDVVYVVCHGSAGDVPVTGWIVELAGSEAFLATPVSSVTGVPNQAKGKSHGTEIAFIRVPTNTISLSRPDNWSGLRLKDLPPWEASVAAWKQVTAGNLSSSEAERPATKGSRPAKSRVEMDLGALGALFQKGREDADEEDETDDDEDGWEPASYLRPGAPASSRARVTKEAKPKKDIKETPDLRTLLAQSLASGQSSSELMPLMMMTMLLEKDKKGSRRRRDRASGSSDLLGGGSSDDSEAEDDLRGKGMRAVSTLHRLQAQVQKRPRKVCEIFEKEVIEELGVAAGQSWTLRDFVKRQSWGKFKGIYRCAMMDVAAYELIRQGKPDQAAAQLVQNLKAKIQSVLAQGDWQAAWLLTGLPDPMVRKEFAGTKEEMSVLADYMSSLAKLKKRVKEAQSHSQHEDEEEATGIHVLSIMQPGWNASKVAFTEVVSDRGQAREWWGRAFVNTFDFALKLLGEVSQFASFELVAGLLECQGKRSVLEDMLKLNCASYGGAEAGIPSGALPVCASRVAIPDAAGRVDPLEWLPSDQAAVVGDLEAVRLPEHLWEDVVVACHRVPEDEENDLAEKLLSTGMAELVKETDLPHTSEGKLLVGGLFCVGKNDSEDRLIFDRRPENSTMPRLAWEELPSGACFTRMLLGPDQYLRGSGDDLRNFYYMLRLPPGWVRFNSVGRRVSSDVVKKHGGTPGVAYRLCFRVLGMGDRNGCSIAQATHEAILRKFGLLRPENKLTYGKFVPEADLWEGVYLDDLLVTLRVTLDSVIPLDGSFQPPPLQADDPDMVHTAVAEDAYEKAGLQRATHKAFRGVTRFKAWGAEVDGIRGTVGAPLEMRQQVWSLIAKTVHAGTASKEILQKLLGFIAFIFQYRREMFSLIHHLYIFVEKLVPGKKVWLPAFVLDELRSVALHLPMAQWCMRKRLHSSLLATDATPTSGGAVRATVSASLLRELWRRSELRGSPVRLDRDNLNLAGEAPIENSCFAAAISESLPWEVVGSFSFRRTSHINLQEARALRREIVKLTADFNNSGTIQVALNDSLVVVGSVSKGRSSSFKLNGVLRGQLPFLIFADVTLALLWIETCANLADHPSRFNPLPSPSLPEEWMQKFGVALDASPPWPGDWLRLWTGDQCLLCSEVNAYRDEEVFSERIDDLIERKEVRWLWLAPPLRTFSTLHKSCVTGEWRPRGLPEGDSSVWRIARDNLLWNRVLDLARQVMEQGGHFILIHPQLSKAWQMRTTELFMQSERVFVYKADMCAYEGGSVPPARRPTTLLSNFPWLHRSVRRCPGPGTHKHGVSGGVARNQIAGDFPAGFIEEVVGHHAAWPRYRRNLRDAGQWLLGVVSDVGGSLSPSSPPQTVDRWLEKAVAVSYERGERRYWVVLGVLSIQRAFSIAGPLLKNTWIQLRGWRRMEPIKTRGFSYHGRLRAEWWSVMIGCWLAFEGLLRPGEVDELKISDLCFPEADELGQGISLVVGIRSPKTKRVWARQFALVQEQSLIMWLRWWVTDRPRRQRVLLINRRRWAILFKEALGELRMGECGYTLGSLRGGGATHQFRRHRNLGQLQFAGRWSRPETLQHYLQEALSVQVVAQASDAAKQLLLRIHEHAHRLDAPPSIRLRRLLAPADRARSTRRKVLRLERAPASRALSSSGGAGAGRGMARSPDAPAPAEDMNAAAVPADQLLQAVQRAATDLGDAPVDAGLTAAEVLADPQRREVAARWRAGSSLRKFTSVLARMSQALQACSGVAAPTPARGPGAHRPRPLLLEPTQASAPSAANFLWTFNVGQLRRHMPQLRWRTIAAALVVLLFPRLCALLLALAVRLLLRAVASLVSSLFQEVWLQVVGAAAEVEQQLVEWLQVQMGFLPALVPSPPPLLQAVGQPPPVQSQASPGSGNGNPHPTRPLLADAGGLSSDRAAPMLFEGIPPVFEDMPEVSSSLALSPIDGEL